MRRYSSAQQKIIEIAALMRRRQHALFGAHARNAVVAHDPRMTGDIDLLVPDAAAARRAGEAIVERIPGLSTRATPFGLVQVIERRSGEKIADLLPALEPITMAAFSLALRCAVPGLGRMRVPPRELLIAMKLDSASDSRRESGRAFIDIGDAIFMLKAGGVDEADLKAALGFLPARARKLYARLKKGWRP